MTKVDTAILGQHLTEYLREAVRGRSVIKVNTDDGDVILMSMHDYEALMKHAGMSELKNDELFYTKEEFYRKIDRGLEQIHAGLGIVKTLDELRAMEAEIE